MFPPDAPLPFAIVAAFQAALVWQRLLAYLRYFQQETYEHVRFLRWCGVRSLTDPAFWLSVACAFAASRLPATSLAAFAAGVVLLVVAQPDPRRTGKVPLRLTWRAARVLSVALVLATAAWVLVALLFGQAEWQSPFVASSFVFGGLPLVLIAGNACLAPYERFVQKRFEADARRRVDEVRPFIIGITGSYGKSSTKAMLAHVLQFKAPTLAAPGSVNTLMGLTRHIREELVLGHRFMVVEMGAFRTGSIRRLCQLAPPAAGIVTAVGDMHLERFGSFEEIVRAKGELAEAIPPGGWVVANADSPGALALVAQAAGHCRVLLYGESSSEDLATRVQGIAFSKQGTTFVLRTRERAHACFTPLVGRPIIHNLAGVFTLASAIGLDPELVVAAFRTLRPVANRLEVVEERGITWIRDAYNSNQLGFRAALEVAAALPAARRFLATPGVVELGSSQYEVNRALAREASEVCDATLVVADANREAFVAGHKDAGREAQVVCVPNRDEAFRWIRETARAGDAVILENDLPDLYERTAGIFWRAPAGAPSGAGAAS
jgi:UDP-N-acetylmuramoyl-tripeptide--D-alanyl-D-alanine ligase